MKHPVLPSFPFTLCAYAFLGALVEGNGSTVQGQEAQLFGGNVSSCAFDGQNRD
jgi:hypothetical protein